MGGHSQKFGFVGRILSPSVIKTEYLSTMLCLCKLLAFCLQPWCDCDLNFKKTFLIICIGATSN
jgi:hypothetical protein